MTDVTGFPMGVDTEVLNDAPGEVGQPFVPPSPFPPTRVDSADSVDAIEARLATLEKPPVIEEAPSNVVELPAGLISRTGAILTSARVREMTGADEERMARIDFMKNFAIWITELLTLCVEDIGGEAVNKEVIRNLLIGDRDALLLGIRKVTYGTDVEIILHCQRCDKDSEVLINIDEDVEVRTMAERGRRQYEVELRNGKMALVHLLDGIAQEAFSDNAGLKTSPEIATMMLSKSVTEIAGNPTLGTETAVRRLSAADRATIVDFIAAHSPGPQMNKEIEVACATCDAKYPVLLGIANLFRL